MARFNLRARLMVALGVCILLVVAAALLWLRPPGRPDAGVAAVYDTPLAPPGGALSVYHLGHSLVGRDMPAMLAQLAPAGHSYRSQLGWGTSLREHWEPDLPINGFADENGHPHYRGAREAVGSGDYDAVILTEMVELRDALRHHAGGAYFARWADLAQSAVPKGRVYLYETWHPLDDPGGWLARIDADLRRAWLGRLARPTVDAGTPVYLIPAGQVMAALTRAVEARGGVGPMTDRRDLFRRGADGAQDQIHPNDLGNYLIALTHYAVLYHRTPVGLPHALRRADGSPAASPGAALARLMQQTVWDVVRSLPETGVRP